MSSITGYVIAAALASFGTSAFARESGVPICERVSVIFRSENVSEVDSDRLRKAQGFMLRGLADFGYSAKYVSFYAPGEPVAASREAEVLAEAGDEPRILIEIEYTDGFVTQNLGLRIYKLAANPPYRNQPYYNGNETIGPIKFGARLKKRFRALLRAEEMIECGELAKTL